MSDRLSDLIQDAFRVTCEAEKVAAHGPKGDVYRALLDAHSALLRARNHYVDTGAAEWCPACRSRGVV